MSYAILSPSGPQNFLLLLSKEEYDCLKKAVKYLRFVLSMEEMMAILTDSFFEWEKALYCSLLEDMVYNQRMAESYKEKKILLIRRLVSLLTSLKMYDEFLMLDNSHQLNESEGLMSELPAIRYVLRNEINKSPSANFVYQLRNFAQHRSFPITAVGRQMKLKEDEDVEERGFRLRPVLKGVEISKDKRLFENLPKGIDEGEDVDLDLYVRGFMASVSKAHEQIRASLEEFTDRSIENLRYARQSYADANPTSSISGLCLNAYDENGGKIESVGLSWNMVDELNRLQERNKNLKHFEGKTIKLNVVNRKES